jgi:hypothetical protein
MPRIIKSKNRIFTVLAIMSIFIFSIQAFGQATNAALSGTVQDASEAYLPGVTITATNVDTGIETTTLTNSSGLFNFASLRPGTYTVSAELEGFQKNTRTDVDLTGAQQNRLDFELQVAGLSEEIEVVTTAQDILTESSSSTGTVLRSQDVIDLPLTSNDVLELVNIMGGVTPIQGSDIFTRDTQTFAGVNTDSIHVQQDGITINDVRYNTGISSQSRINTEMVSEFKLILSPVDAEMGRGAGQVQILTKSGANAYHGSGVWNITNTALDANTWSNNRSGQSLPWRNLNTYTLTFSGPIVKNKTFFFVTWDHAIPRTHSNAVPTVLTPCARKGVFRYFDGWMTGHYDRTITYTGATPRRASVDLNGFPLDQDLADSMGYAFVGLDEGSGEVDGQGRPLGHIVQPIGELQYTSVFGPLTDEARDLIEQDPIDCEYYKPYEGNYDMSNPTSAESLSALGITRYFEGDGVESPVFRVLDTQAIPNFSDVMPPPNSWRDNGDGLNYATHRWTRSQHGSDNIYGVGEENARKNISFKVDHNFDDRNRISVNYTYERDVNPSATKLWPNGYAGTTERTPQRFSVSYTSTLKPTLLNEARFGLNRNFSHSLNALDASETRDEIRSLMNSMVDTSGFQNFPPGEPLVFNPLLFGTNYPAPFFNGNLYVANQSHFIGGRVQGGWGLHSFLPSWGGFDHRWQISDTLTYTRGRHSFKFGGEVRLIRSHQDADGDIGFLSRLSMPTAVGGITEWTRPDDLLEDANADMLSGLVGSESFFPWANLYRNGSSGTLRGVQDLRDYMAGSLAYIWQWFFINDPEQKSWNNVNEGEITRILDIRYKEFAFFAKDDWKVNNSLTLNLGLRYEYFGVPYIDNGMTLGLQGGAYSLFGVSGRDFSTWMAEHPVNLGEEYYTAQEFIGPASGQQDIGAFEKDLNNFGPAVGFAWQLPWFGKGKTTLRGGYQLTFSQIANADAGGGGFSDVLAGSTGTNVDYYYAGDSVNHPYLRIADVDTYLPTIQYLQTGDNPIEPLSTLNIKNRDFTLSVYDPEIVNPYTQSLNLSVTRNIGSNVTMDVRYIGTLGRKGVGNLDLNTNNWLYNGLKGAFDEARRGENPELLDKLFDGIQTDDSDLGNTIAVGEPGGPTGGDVLRALYPVQLGEGDYNGIADALNTANYSWQEGGVVCPYPWAPNFCFPQAGLNDTLPQPEINESGAILRHANTVYPGEFPENFIVANPQLDVANWYTNLNHNNYHSMQVRVEVRPTHDFNMTSTYTWSKNLGNSNYTNPNDRANPFDYTWTGGNRSHQFNSYGAWTLPFGANGFFFRDISNPIARRFIEGWNLSWILSLNSGGWSNMSADATHLYGNSVPNIVRPDLFDGKGGHITWEPGAFNGWYFGDPDQYAFGPDLQCFDGDLVYYDYDWVQVDDDVFIPQENTATSLRSDCTENMSALYIPMTEIVTEWYEPTQAEIDAGIVPNVYGYASREVEQQIYSPQTVIFQHPLPAEYGSYGRNKIRGPGSFSLDMAMGKTFQLTEGKSIQFRVDASNVLNHPSPGGPNTSINQNNSNGLGYIGSKSGSRRFQAKLTIRF